ncbi:MAG: hypothetical protein GXO35_05765, partial [Gammaproteobacteria bacterium]|nr:hypothetical protein [Gammaproteobacteria bacterium]
MSLTISELESERAKILEEIESKAQTFSSGPKMDATDNHSLTDWLNAAEEVMPVPEPQRKKPKMRTPKNKSNYSAQMMQPSKNRASFFGVIIMLSLLLTLLGVLYIAYSSINKELQNVTTTNQATLEQLKQLQEDMLELQKSMSTGGKADVFITLEDKVFALEAKVEAFQQGGITTTDLTAKTASSTTMTNTEVAMADPAKAEAAETLTPVKPTSHSNLVTEAILDQKLKAYTEHLEEKIDHKLEVILQHITKGSGQKIVSTPSQEAQQPAAQPQPEIQAPKAPSVTETKTPIINQPLLQMVKEVSSPIKPVEPVTPTAPNKHYSEDVKWLLAQPAVHYVLQLASMPSKHSLELMAEKKQLTDIKIIPQTRNDVTNYIMVT